MKIMASHSLSPAVIALLFICDSSIAVAHDLRGILVQEPNSASPQIEAALAATPPADVSTRSVLNNLQLWPVPRQLTICFDSGSALLRKRVSEAMRRLWPIGALSQGRIDFDKSSFDAAADCGAHPTADIRIDFKPGDGYWSYVGIESLNHNPSMNLQSFTETTPTRDELDRLVAHETGHALGLEHEHQSPVAPDCGWNFPYIRSHYVWASDADMHANFDRLHDYVYQDRHTYVFSTYDQLSIMHYDFEPEAFNDGKNSPCYITRNKVPSTQDQNALKIAYGPNVVANQALARSSGPTLGAQFSGPAYDKLRDLIQLKISNLP